MANAKKPKEPHGAEIILEQDSEPEQGAEHITNQWTDQQ